MRSALYFIALILWTLPGQSAWAGRQSAEKPAEKPHDVESLLSELDHAMAGWQDYQVKGDSEANGKHDRFKVYFKRPDLVRVDAKDGQVAVQPNGTIRGRLGHGIFGRISRGLRRDDKRLRDDEGVPFYDNYFPALTARFRQWIKDGGVATMSDGPTGYVLEIRSDKTVRKYTFDKSNFSLLEGSRTIDGRLVGTTHYTDFRCNTGLSQQFFRF